MRSKFFSFIFIFGSLQTFAQPPKVHHEFGLNVTAFAKQFLSLNTASGATSPFMISYSSDGKCGGVRTAVGWTFDHNVTDASGTQPKIENRTNSGTVRIGYEKQFHLLPRWALVTGADGWYQKTYSRTQTQDGGGGTTTTITDVSGPGIGSLIGIHFSIKDRILLGTESNLVLQFLQSLSSSTSSTFPSSNFKTTGHDTAFSISNPVALFFYFRF